jgi:hypothetical protein
MLTKTNLLQFFAERPSLSASSVGIEAGYAQGKWLRTYLADDTAPEQVPPLMAAKLLPIIKKYGHNPKIINCFTV